jgi:hypothetical protein
MTICSCGRVFPSSAALVRHRDYEGHRDVRAEWIAEVLERLGPQPGLRAMQLERHGPDEAGTFEDFVNLLLTGTPDAIVLAEWRKRPYTTK